MTSRTHSQIVRDAGVTPLREQLGSIGIVVADPTVRSWERRDGIPAEYWQPLADLGLATLEELASAKALTPAADAQEAAA